MEIPGDHPPIRTVKSRNGSVMQYIEIMQMGAKQKIKEMLPPQIISDMNLGTIANTTF